MHTHLYIDEYFTHTVLPEFFLSLSCSLYFMSYPPWCPRAVLFFLSLATCAPTHKDTHTRTHTHMYVYIHVHCRGCGCER